MSDPWLPLLHQLPLTKTEKEVVKRYESDPEGRSFLPVADILRSHKLVAESLELLTQGVAHHPTFTVARVVLARELLARGMVKESWFTLEDSPVPLRENVLAQKLRFKIALLLRKEDLAEKTKAFLRTHHMLDHETAQLAEQLEISGIDAVRQELLKTFAGRNIDLELPGEERGEENEEEVSPFIEGEAVDLSYSEDKDSFAGFHVVSLKEIFKPKDRGGQGIDTGGVELDSTTLADIYERQGHFAKALNIYRRLLRMTPQNSLLQQKVAQLAKLDREQKDVDLTLDPSLVDRMEAVEIIDRQVRFLNSMLEKLNDKKGSGSQKGKQS